MPTGGLGVFRGRFCQARLPGRILRLKKRLRQSSIGAGGDPERGCSSQHWMAVGRRLLKVLNSKKLSCWEDLIVKVPAKSRKDILQQSGVATSLLVRDFQEKNAQTSGATVLPRFWPVTIDELRQMALPLLWICLALPLSWLPSYQEVSEKRFMSLNRTE